jgi:hypothetical protein
MPRDVNFAMKFEKGVPPKANENRKKETAALPLVPKRWFVTLM